jgi:Tfp pilus assembly protein PilO
VNRRVLGIGALATVLVLVLWYMLLWRSATDDVQAAKDRREAAEQQALQLQSEIQRLRSAQRNEPAQRARLELLKSGIPDDPNLAQFILDTNDAAVRSDIDFISVAPALPTAGTGTVGQAAATTATTATTVATASLPAEIRVTLQVQGGYFQVLDFLNRLDQMPRIVVTDGLNVTADQSGRLAASVTARIFTTAVPAAFGGTATTTTTVAGATTTTTAAGGATTTTVAGGATTTTTTTTIAGARP